jgi:serine/threonine-protein phosphatase 2A regulatory subunit B'
MQSVMNYLEKDPSVADQCIYHILKYWPVINPTKEILFLNEIEDVNIFVQTLIDFRYNAS